MAAQQEGLYTQFMFNKLELNPGFTGQTDGPELSAVFRDQWIGLEGAPSTQKLSFNLPLVSDHIGFGITFNRHTIGISKRLTAQLSYAYAFKTGKRSKMSIGINGSIRQLQLDFTDERLLATENIDLDPAIERTKFQTWFANVGVGIYFYEKRYYVGISSPRLLESSLEFGSNTDLSFMEARRVMAMGGYEFDLSDELDLVAQGLIKWTDNSPVNVELNATLHVMKQFFGGLGYRSYNGTGGVAESFDLLAGVFLDSGLMFALSYDIGLNKLKNYHSGSIELTVKYRFNPLQDKFVNPRFF